MYYFVCRRGRKGGGFCNTVSRTPTNNRVSRREEQFTEDNSYDYTPEPEFQYTAKHMILDAGIIIVIIGLHGELWL